MDGSASVGTSAPGSQQRHCVLDSMAPLIYEGKRFCGSMAPAALDRAAQGDSGRGPGNAPPSQTRPRTALPLLTYSFFKRIRKKVTVQTASGASVPSRAAETATLLTAVLLVAAGAALPRLRPDGLLPGPGNATMKRSRLRFAWWTGALPTGRPCPWLRGMFYTTPAVWRPFRRWAAAVFGAAPTSTSISSLRTRSALPPRNLAGVC